MNLSFCILLSFLFSSLCHFPFNSLLHLRILVQEETKEDNSPRPASEIGRYRIEQLDADEMPANVGEQRACEGSHGRDTNQTSL